MTMSTTTNFGLPKPALGDAGGTKVTEYNTAIDAADSAIMSAIRTLDFTPDDLSYSGADVYKTAGSTVAFGQVCYYASDGTFKLAKSTDIQKMPCVAMATTALATNSAGYFLLGGTIRNDSTFTYVAGTFTGQIWVSETTAGVATHTEPTASSSLVQNIGFAVSTCVLCFDPIRTLVKV